MLKKLLLGSAVLAASLVMSETASAYDCYGGFGHRGVYRAPVAAYRVPVYRAPINYGFNPYRSGYRGGFDVYRSRYRGGFNRGFGPGFNSGFGPGFGYGRGFGRSGVGISIGF